MSASIAHSSPSTSGFDALKAIVREFTPRLRDQWHGMSRTGTVASLWAHAPEPALALHPSDAARRGFVDGDLLRVELRRGAVVVPRAISGDVRPGSPYLPMLWVGDAGWRQRRRHQCSDGKSVLSSVEATGAEARGSTHRQRGAAVEARRIRLSVGRGWTRCDAR